MKNQKIEKEQSELIELAVDQIYKLDEIVRDLGGNAIVAINLAHEAQKIERAVDEKYR